MWDNAPLGSFNVIRGTQIFFLSRSENKKLIIQQLPFYPCVNKASRAALPSHESCRRHYSGCRERPPSPWLPALHYDGLVGFLIVNTKITSTSTRHEAACMVYIQRPGSGPWSRPTPASARRCLVLGPVHSPVAASIPDNIHRLVLTSAAITSAN